MPAEDAPHPSAPSSADASLHPLRGIGCDSVAFPTTPAETPELSPSSSAVLGLVGRVGTDPFGSIGFDCIRTRAEHATRTQLCRRYRRQTEAKKVQCRRVAHQDAPKGFPDERRKMDALGARGRPASTMSSSLARGTVAPRMAKGRRRGNVGAFATNDSGSEGKRQWKSPIDVLQHDLLFMDKRAKEDVARIATAHEQVVGTLNPVASKAERLRNEIRSVQDELRNAQSKLHVSETRVGKTLEQIEEMQTVVNRSAGVKPKQRGARSGRKLSANFEIPAGLKNYWFPVQFTSKLEEGDMLAFELFETPWVMFRDKEGKAVCVHDECPHRACPLSIGKVVDGNIVCPYHGWEVDGEGVCVNMPQVTPQVSAARPCVRRLPCEEIGGMIWIWTGEEGVSIPPVESERLLPPANKGFCLHAEIAMDVPVEHGLLIENLLDLAHAPFTHTSTFAKGWAVPDLVNFQTAAARALAGNWEPYPIDMSFEPPCITLSTIGLAQPGKLESGVRQSQCKNHLHQMHVCLPAGPKSTRLLYRMHLDFLGWVKHIPGIQKLWEYMAGQVLGEDLRLVLGQQDRLERGGDVWGHPVPYDKLGVRYRRWRNGIDDISEREQVEENMKTLSAREIFMDDLYEV